MICSLLLKPMKEEENNWGISNLTQVIHRPETFILRTRPIVEIAGLPYTNKSLGSGHVVKESQVASDYNTTLTIGDDFKIEQQKKIQDIKMKYTFL